MDPQTAGVTTLPISLIRNPRFDQRKSREAYKSMFGEDDTLWGGPNAYRATAKNVIDIIINRIGHRGGR